jgi:glycosyltransferase involved in cell wall biosynthesis
MTIDLQDVTVIVPTRDEATNIGPFLWSLNPRVWLIVVDASEDETPTLVAQQRSERTTVICEPTTVTQARQLGAIKARTAWLLFSDADISFASTYFRRLQAHPADADLIYGAKHSAGDYQRYYRWFSWGQAVAHSLGLPAASGSNLLIRRSVFWACGGFDLQLTVNEDSELGWRVKRAGHRVCYDRELVVYERDHRRLRRGVARKTVHSLARCLLLYLNLIPARWRRSDWGYWAGRPRSQGSR